MGDKVQTFMQSCVASPNPSTGSWMKGWLTGIPISQVRGLTCYTTMQASKSRIKFWSNFPLSISKSYLRNLALLIFSFSLHFLPPYSRVFTQMQLTGIFSYNKLGGYIQIVSTGFYRFIWKADRKSSSPLNSLPKCLQLNPVSQVRAGTQPHK